HGKNQSKLIGSEKGRLLRDYIVPLMIGPTDYFRAATVPCCFRWWCGEILTGLSLCRRTVSVSHLFNIISCQ
ncbi:hypothetical protein ACFLXT_04860, partial [Chloroflexota bacterium]